MHKFEASTDSFGALQLFEAVQRFIGTPEYLEHKKKRFKSLGHDVAKSGAFKIDDENIRKQFEEKYSNSSSISAMIWSHSDRSGISPPIPTLLTPRLSG